MPNQLSSDVLVIGSGPGGSITAYYLARAGYDVILAEEGPGEEAPPTALYSLDEMNVRYRNGGLTPCLGSMKTTYAEARCLGGGSEINAGLYFRPAPEMLMQWSKEHGIVDLSLESLMPHLQEIEDRLSVSSLPFDEDLLSRKVHQGAEKLGWHSELVPRWYTYSMAIDGTWSFKRNTVSTAFVAPAKAYGCRVVPNLRIGSIVIKNGYAISATGSVLNGYRTEGRVSFSFKWLFLCAGAIQTPFLLRRSGIFRNIGNTLRMHPYIRVAAKFPEDVNEDNTGVPVRQVLEFKPNLTLGCSMSSLPHLGLWAGGGDMEQRTSIISEYRKMGVFYALIVARSLGRIRKVPFIEEPLVQYDLDDHDLQALGDGLNKLGQLLLSAGAEEITVPVSGTAPVKTMDALRLISASLPRGKTDVTALHLFSSCPLGENKKRYPLDSYGKLVGYKNIHVNDASMLPGCTGVNPQGTIMALAARNVHNFMNNGMCQAL